MGCLFHPDHSFHVRLWRKQEVISCSTDGHLSPSGFWSCTAGGSVRRTIFSSSSCCMSWSRCRTWSLTWCRASPGCLFSFSSGCDVHTHTHNRSYTYGMSELLSLSLLSQGLGKELRLLEGACRIAALSHQLKKQVYVLQASDHRDAWCLHVDPGADPEHTGGIYISHLAWESLGIPQEELKYMGIRVCG